MKVIKNRQGFTIPELLITVAIMICLSAVSIVGIVTYMKHLKITELDNAAKEIYLAAQNRAIVLNSGNTFKNFVVKNDSSNQMLNVDVAVNEETTSQITAYYISNDDANISNLLPKQSIESSLWDGHFYIVYEVESRSVIDVFFSWDEIPSFDTSTEFRKFYDEFRALSKGERMKEKPMIGYYGGETAVTGTSIALRTPVINIYNEDTLEVTVTYWVPRILRIVGDSSSVKLNVNLAYQEINKSLTLNTEPTIEEDLLYISYTHHWVLDSMNNGKRFSDFIDQDAAWMTNSRIYGDDFTITAEVSYDGTYQVNGAKKIATDNSLFAKGSSDEVAYIAYERHLQNLDSDFSQVSNTKTSAEQIADIACVSDRSFEPIQNDSLKSYDGKEFEIKDLTINGTGNVGLFQSLKGTESDYKNLTNIRLVNMELQAEGEEAVAGSLVAEGSYLRIEGCKVYWVNDDSASTNLRDVLGDSESEYKYKLKSEALIGGLAGNLENSMIQHCAVSTMISGEQVGGMIGKSKNVTINGSYVSSYLSGQQVSGISIVLSEKKVSNSYVTGFVESPNNGKAAGFSIEGATTYERCYSTMLFTPNNENKVTNYPLAAENGNKYEKTYFLDLIGIFPEDTQKDQARDYDVLSDSSQWDALFGESHIFEKKSEEESHPYNLQTTLELSAYVYPGIREQDHYGDWGARFQDGSLVYYEKYKDGSYGFNGGNLNLLKDDKEITEDGYGVVYKTTEELTSIKTKIYVTYQTGEEKTEEEEMTYSKDSIYSITAQEDGKPVYYFIYPFSGNIVCSEYASEEFYQKISIKVDNKTKTYYYNPHFAKAILPYGEEGNEKLSNNLNVEIRTPRHLYHLSQFEEYYNSENVYNYLQQLDLDYDTYTGHGLFLDNAKQQTPIGKDKNHPFKNNYYGNGNTIRSLDIKEEGDYIGLFGYNTGNIQDVVFYMNDKTGINVINQTPFSIKYLGALAGYNRGIIDNCAVAQVHIEANTYLYSSIYSGGMIGQNEGVVTNCSADVAYMYIDTTFSNAYVGGFVGYNSNGGRIIQSYAVGLIEARRSRSGTVDACGFAGKNEETIRQSYSAMGITVSGGAERYGFSTGKSVDCVYLNKGNFVYNDDTYTAQYEDSYAKPIEYLDFQNKENGLVQKLQMSNQVTAKDGNKAYPYPGNVTAKDGSYSHYGQWPELMNLGIMGVYYWEKMETPVEGSSQINESYHISSITVDLNNKKVSKESTLSTEHNDGAVITEFGYGYFSSLGTNVTAENLFDNTEGKICYGVEGIDNFLGNPNYENSNTNQALKKLLGGQFEFHSYDAWHKDENDKNVGMYLVRDDDLGGQRVQATHRFDLTSNKHVSTDFQLRPPVGTWKLKYNNVESTFKITPLFADAISYVDTTGNEQLTVETDVPKTYPGTADNPYEVRSIEQLQFINWNGYYKNTTTPIENLSSSSTEAGRTKGRSFSFLSYMYTSREQTVTLRDYYWEQSHDIDASECKNYMPIAGLRDYREPSFIQSWFGGSYDGKDYTIIDLNIKTTDINTVGLFGFTIDAELKNIVLHSSHNSAQVEVIISNQELRKFNEKHKKWYAVGALVGLAANIDKDAPDIQNCAVSGYTIIDNTQYIADGGANIGGLIGVCNMALENCTGYVNIDIKYKHEYGWFDTSQSVRVGGLVGACQENITNCYVGGEITVQNIKNIDSKVYCGGLVGGYTIRTLTYVNGKEVESKKINSNNDKPLLSNCYTYVKLPNKENLNSDSKLYAIGGLGEISFQNSSLSRYENCFYLKLNLSNISEGQWESDIVDYEAEGVVGCELQDLTSEGTAYKILTDNGFYPVTTTTKTGAPINGKFSIAVSDQLLGTNYPFPTILTQESNLVERGNAHIHYGDWPVIGLQRDEGALPVNLDMFVDYDQNTETVSHTEQIRLSNISNSGSGNWSVSDDSSGVVTANVDQVGNLSIIANKQGSATVTVSYTLGEQTVSLGINVNVTAVLQVAASSTEIQMFQNAMTSAGLKLKDGNGQEIDPNRLNEIKIETLSVNYDSAFLSSVEWNQENSLLELQSQSLTGDSRMTVQYDYTYKGIKYQNNTSVIYVNVQEDDVALSPFEIDLEGKMEKVVPYTSKNVKINREGITNIKLSDFNNLEDSKQFLYATWEDENDRDQGMLLEAYSNKEETGSEIPLMVQVEFEYGGNKHVMWKEQPVVIYNNKNNSIPEE